MTLCSGFSGLNRRQFLAVAPGVTIASLNAEVADPQIPIVKEGTVRDRLWVFACPVNNDYPHLRRRSLMTPAESAFFFGIPNILIIQVRPRPGEEEWFRPFEPPFDQYAIALRPLKRVVWSVVGGGGVTEVGERKQVLEMSKRISNFVGVYMDDFFHPGDKQLASLAVGDLRDLQNVLKGHGKELDLCVTLYTHQLDLPLGEYLNLIDVVTLWTWKPVDLVNLEVNFSKLERVAPRTRKMLGCYVVDYDNRTSTPIPAMQHQCELGLRWLKEKRIEGIVFLGNSVMDLGYEAVDWTRDWIERVAESKL